MTRVIAKLTSQQKYFFCIYGSKPVRRSCLSFNTIIFNVIRDWLEASEGGTAFQQVFRNQKIKYCWYIFSDVRLKLWSIVKFYNHFIYFKSRISFCSTDVGGHVSTVERHKRSIFARGNYKLFGYKLVTLCSSYNCS